MIYKDYHEFIRAVGLILNYQELTFLGFDPKVHVGSFGLEDLPQLEAFCAENPEYHIVSMGGGDYNYRNYIKRDCSLFFLADGDKNPKIVFEDKCPQFFHYRDFV